MEIRISRIDYNNPDESQRFRILPTLHSTSALIDANEVNQIGIIFDSQEEADQIFSKFPKHVRMQKSKFWGTGHQAEMARPYISARFQTFFPNKVTGAANESAIKARNKALEILRALEMDI